MTSKKQEQEPAGNPPEKFLPNKKQLRHLPKVLSKKERYLIFVLAVVALLALIAIPISAYYHFTKVAPAHGGTITEGMVGAPKFINPLLAQTNDVDRDLSELIFAGLMRYDNAGKIDYGLARSYDVSDDGLTYTFHLKGNLKWQDGQPLTADDVVFTILTAQNSNYGSYQRANWQGVDVSKGDDLTVVFKLKNKYAQFLNNTTLGILPKHIWQNIKPSNFSLSELNTKPIGAGPYKFSRIRKDSTGNITQYEVASFNKYYDGQPHISKIVFKFYNSEDDMIGAYNNNSIDQLGSISPEKLNSLHFLGQLKIQRLSLPRYFAAFFNQNQSKALSDKNARLALSYATNKQEILKKILSGNGTEVNSPMLPGILGVPGVTTKYEYDQARAQKILEDAGWILSGGGTRVKTAAVSKGSKNPPEATKLEIELTTSNWPELVSVANDLKLQWEAVGVKVNLKILALPELQQAIKDRDYETLLFGEVLSLDPDPFSFWHSSQKRDPGLNLALYDNKDADKILEDARQTLDNTERFSKYDSFQKLVINDIPALFLYSPYYLYAQSAKVKNYNTQTIATPSDRFTDVAHWYIDTTRVKK